MGLNTGLAKKFIRIWMSKLERTFGQPNAVSLLEMKKPRLKVIAGLANGPKAINEDSNPGNLMLQPKI